MNILEIKKLSVEYYRNKKIIHAVKNFSLTVQKGETLAIAGESGSGKSTVALSILNLIMPYEGKITSGKILFHNHDILDYTENDLRSLRGSEISMIFQDPFSSLNPVLTAGEQIIESLSAHRYDLTKNEKEIITEKTLKEVMFTDPKRIMNSYPHQLSGGQRQRIVIAAAIINRPQILIADEPTTALDVTIQKEILDLIDKLKKELNLTVILITHNLPLAYERSSRIAVMYGGELVELGDKEAVFHHPEHPYTQKLINSVPKLLVKRKVS